MQSNALRVHTELRAFYLFLTSLSCVSLSDELAKMSPEARALAQTQLDELLSVLPVYTEAELKAALMQVENENKAPE